MGSTCCSAFPDCCLSSPLCFNCIWDGGLTNRTSTLKEGMWDRTYISCVFPSHIPLTMPVRMHLDPNMHMFKEIMQWHQRAVVACDPVSMSVLLLPILCILHVDLQPDHVYQQRLRT